MEGIELVVELKTGRRIRGILSSADEAMNLTLEGAEEEGGPVNNQSQESNNEGHPGVASFEDITSEIQSSMTIRGPTVRYIHFPDNADLTSLVRVGIDRERAASNKYKRGKRK